MNDRNYTILIFHMNIDQQSNTACIAFSHDGAIMAKKLQKTIMNISIYVRPQDAKNGLIAHEKPLSVWTERMMQQKRLIIFIGSAGIAVRSIAPFLKSKTIDPAILCIDDQGRYVIPLVSGHLGGANHWASWIAKELDAEAIITTGTDGRGLMAVDEWARQNHLFIENPDKIVRISSAVLDGKKVGFYSEKPFPMRPSGMTTAKTGRLGVYVGIHLYAPFDETLLIRPHVLTIGIGCKRGISMDNVEKAIFDFLTIHHYSIHSVQRIASIDIKANEIALLSIAKKYNWQFTTHNRESLLAENGIVFSQSDFVQKTVGVDCVCERAAIKHGTLLVKKCIYPSMTLALSEEPWGF